jgi:hypothetical protein
MEGHRKRTWEVAFGDTLLDVVMLMGCDIPDTLSDFNSMFTVVGKVDLSTRVQFRVFSGTMTDKVSSALATLFQNPHFNQVLADAVGMRSQQQLEAHYTVGFQGLFFFSRKFFVSHFDQIHRVWMRVQNKAAACIIRAVRWYWVKFAAENYIRMVPTPCDMHILSTESAKMLIMNGDYDMMLRRLLMDVSIFFKDALQEKKKFFTWISSATVMVTGKPLMSLTIRVKSMTVLTQIYNLCIVLVKPMVLGVGFQCGQKIYHSLKVSIEDLMTAWSEHAHLKTSQIETRLNRMEIDRWVNQDNGESTTQEATFSTDLTNLRKELENRTGKGNIHGMTSMVSRMVFLDKLRGVRHHALSGRDNRDVSIHDVLLRDVTTVTSPFESAVIAYGVLHEQKRFHRLTLFGTSSVHETASWISRSMCRQTARPLTEVFCAGMVTLVLSDLVHVPETLLLDLERLKHIRTSFLGVVRKAVDNWSKLEPALKQLETVTTIEDMFRGIWTNRLHTVLSAQALLATPFGKYCCWEQPEGVDAHRDLPLFVRKLVSVAWQECVALERLASHNFAVHQTLYDDFFMLHAGSTLTV